MSNGAGPYSKTLRRLHLAFICFIAVLALSGLIFHYRKPLGLNDFKLEILFFHVAVAYGFIVALGARIVLGGKGAESDRLGHVFPRPGDARRLLGSDKNDRSRFKFAGRSPLSRTIAGGLYLLIASNALTGLIRTGTDLHFLPFGPIVDAYLSGDSAAKALPEGAPNHDGPRAKAVKKMAGPVGKIHFCGALTIISFAFVHVLGVLMTQWSAPNDRLARGRARLMLFGPRRTR